LAAIIGAKPHGVQLLSCAPARAAAAASRRVGLKRRRFNTKLKFIY